MQSTAKNVEEYIAEMPKDRAEVYTKLLHTIRKNIDPKFEEGMGYGMIGWSVPKSIYPEGYHVTPEQPVPFLALANQKNYIAFYHMGVYSDPKTLQWFQEAYAKTGYKLDMGKSCIRLKNLDKIPYELLGELAGKMSLDTFLELYKNVIKR